MAYKNKLKQNESSKLHYEKHKSLYLKKAKENNKIASERNKEYIKQYLSTHPCVDCGNNNPIVLEFDHIYGTKKHNISDLTRSAYSLETIQAEIDKCQVRCANCHRIVTYNRRNMISPTELTPQ